ncbi:hypothetical protein RHD99_14865 [Buttiauxella selenatireducens]|uniref:Uncharacterized protein n=1 Tax=Buttiauxella selenatireducens TaxID=3073902 RepID=A0ABY9S5F8_9ENTR|nr:hypothetical protein [Buttiauxella sp. R73]WMY72752.1 hypothetical protein RHD99_14865 [Buttiauxella sp. R73]
MPKTTSFKVFYDADDNELSQHAIDAEALGNSILSMTKLITKSDDLLNEGNKSIKVLVSNPAEAGSLGVAYTIIELIPDAINVLKTLGITGVVGAAGGATALSLIRQLGSSKVISMTRKADSGTTVLELEGEEIECPTAVAALVTDPTIRDALISVIQKPLEGKQAPVFKILNENEEEVIRLEGVQTEEIKPLPRGTLLEKEVDEREVNVKFTQVNFQSEKGWRMEYNGEEHAVLLNDHEFLAKVRHAEGAISSDDLFAVNLEVTKTYSARNVTEKYVVKKVIRHRADASRRII